MVAVIDYGLGNLTSVAGAVEKLGHEVIVTDDHGKLAAANRLILPGVGAFGDGMENLRRRGLVELLTRLVGKEKRPILGICLGFQLLAEESEEFGLHKGLRWVQGRVRRLAPKDSSLRIPHVGWNGLTQKAASILFQGVAPDSLFYYVHSYVLDSCNPDDVIGVCEYGEQFSAALQTGNIYGTQFHPEKSQSAGLKILDNFLKYA